MPELRLVSIELSRMGLCARATSRFTSQAPINFRFFSCENSSNQCGRRATVVDGFICEHIQLVAIDDFSIFHLPDNVAEM